MAAMTGNDPTVVEKEVTRSAVARAPWHQRMSWGAILAGAVVALLAQFAFEALGIAIGVGAFEPGEDTFGPDFTSAIVVWLAASALISLFIGGIVTGKLSTTADPVDGAIEGVVMMGLVTFVSFFLLTSAVGSTLRGLSNTIGDGLSFIGASAEDVSVTVANAIDIQESTLDDIRADAEELLAEDASFTTLRITIDDYLLEDEPGNDTRQAAIDALATQTTLTREEQRPASTSGKRISARL